MKAQVTFGIVVLLALVMTSWGAPVHMDIHKDHVITMDFVDVSVDGADLIMHCKNDEDTEVVIKEDYSLWVGDEQVSLTPSEEKLVMDFYNATFSLIQDALRIARKGVRLGLKGAKIGLSAAFNAIVAAVMGEDEDSIEARVEEKTSQIEEEANRLEREANGIEERADEVEELLKKMFRTIPALQKLGCVEE